MDLLDQFKEHKKLTEVGLADQYDLAELNHSFYAGDRMAYRVGIKSTDTGSRRIVVFNRVKPFVNAITGFAIKLRRKPSYNATNEDSQEQRIFTDHTNALSDHIRSLSNIDQHETRQDKEMFICGYGGVDTVISHIVNPLGRVKMENIAYYDIGWDPNARDINISDARWIFRKKKMNRKDALALFKGSVSTDFEDAEEGISARETKTSYRLDEGKKEEDLIQVFNYQWWEFENYYRVENPVFSDKLDDTLKGLLLQAMRRLAENDDKPEEDAEGSPINEELAEDLFKFQPEKETLIVGKKIFRALRVLFREFGIKIKFIEHRRKVYYTSILSGITVFFKFKSQDQNGFTIKVKTGDYDEFNKTWQGIVDQLREPSRYSNKALTEILYTIASNSKGGVMYEESAVSDPKRFEEQYASTTAAIMVNDNALTAGAIQDKARSALPSGYENVLQISKQALFETTGVNPEFMGSSENKQVSALLESQRVEQVTSALAIYFDAITYFQKDNAMLVFTYMRILSENNPEMMFRVLGEDGTSQYKKINPDALTAEYEIDVQEVPTSSTQKAQNLSLLMSFAQQVAVLGQNVYPFIVDELPISQKKKEQIAQLLAPREPDPKEIAKKEQMDQITLEGIVAKTMNLMADTDIKKSQVPVNIMKAQESEAGASVKRSQVPGNILDAEQKELENEFLRNREVDLFNVNI